MARDVAAQIRVLGAIDAVDERGNNLGLGGRVQGRLLAVLVAGAPAAIGIDSLCDALWAGDDAPADRVASLRTYVARARAVLGTGSIVTATGSYRLGDVDTDRRRFEELIERARRASGSPTVADLWRQALDLWRGPAFGDFADLETVQAEANRLEELRAEATEAWFDARLAAGEGRELAADVDRAVAEFPLREGFRVQQMTVLSRAGRQGEALRAFQEFRADLTEIGLEPSARLVELDKQIAAGGTPRSGARRTLRGYELGDRIGEGAFAVVYRATQASVGRAVAVKQIRGQLADQPAFIAQFEAEAHLVARLEHPHIVPLYDFWREPGSAFLVMRYLDGGSLGQRLVEGPLPLPEVVAIVGHVAAALDAAHRTGVIHRDVKPANILLDRSGNAYLSDFGIAVEEAERLDPEAWLSNGSPAYAPPEQLERRPVGPTADVYALGVAAFESLTGHLPFPTETTMAGLLQRQLHDPIPLIRLARPELPAAVDAVIQKATAKQPEERYARASEFATELAAAAGLEGDAALITPQDRNPYKGLRAFDAADAADFSGRDRLTARLLAAAGEASAVLVVGPSGSGKSSVVRAGLMAALRQGQVRGSGRWFTTTMTPGANPFAALTSALLRVAIDPPADLLAELMADANGLRRVIRRIVPDGRALVLVIDQLEELFTLAGESDRQGFLDALVAALTDAACGLRLVATIRADFYDHPLRHPAFAALVEDSTVSVHPLAADELERAITEPATAVGASFEPRLVAEISADVADQPGALPLLQYALTELFDAREGNVMTRAAYKRLGGVTGALARRAEEVFVGLSAAEQASARRVFGRLVSLGEGTEDTRRRVTRTELGVDGSADVVLDAFGTARLLSFDRDPATREPTVEVAHEALIREWPRLRGWLNEDRDGLRILRHLTESAAAWDVSGRPDSELYRGGRLEAAEEWAAENRPQLTALEESFLDAGLEARAAEKAAEVERLEAERRSNRRLRRLLAGVAVLAAVAVIAGLLAFQQRSQARESAFSADVRRLVAQSTVLRERDPSVSMLLALEAYRLSESPSTLGAVLTSLQRTDGYLGRIETGIDDTTDQVWLELLDQHTLVARTTDSVDVYDVDTRTLVSSTPAPVSRSGLWPATDASAAGGRYATVVGPGEVLYLDSDHLEPVILDNRRDVAMTGVAVGAGSSVLVGYADGLAERIETKTGTATELGRQSHAVTYLAESDDGRRVALFDAGFNLTVWDTTLGEPSWTHGPNASGIEGGAADDVLVWIDEEGKQIWAGRTEGAAPTEGSVGPNEAPPAERLDFSSDGRYLYSRNAGLLAFDVDSGHVVWQVGDNQGGWSRRFQELDDGRILFGNVIVDDGEVIEAENRSPRITAATSDGALIVTQVYGGFDLRSGDGSQLLASALERGDHDVATLSPDGEMVASFRQSAGDALPVPGLIRRVRDAHVLDGPDDRAWFESFTRDGSFVSFYVLDEKFSDLTTLMRDVSTFEPVSAQLPPQTWKSVEVAVELGVVAVGDGAVGEVRVYGTADGELVRTLTDPLVGCGCFVSFSEDGSRIAVVDNHKIVVWDTGSWEVESTIEPDDGDPLQAVMFADESHILVVSALGTLSRGDLTTETLTRLVASGVRGVGASFHAGGLVKAATDDWFVLAGAESAVVVDGETMEVIGTPFASTGLAVDLSDDGSALLTATPEHLLVWNLDPDQWRATACRAAGRNLTAEEWEQFGPAGLPYHATCSQWPALG